VKPLSSKSRCAGLVLLAMLFSSLPSRADEAVRSRAEGVIRELEARKQDEPLTSGLLRRAHQALERATNARRAGDSVHGSELEALALELAETARDLTRAVAAEREVNELEQKAIDAETRVVRARALVEQTAARRGRAAERLELLEAEKKNRSPEHASPPKAGPEKAVAPKAAVGQPAPSRAKAERKGNP
jgi:colicin import membrane protein